MDYASVVLKVLVSFLSHWSNELMAEFTLYGRVGLVGFAPNVASGWVFERKLRVSACALGGGRFSPLNRFVYPAQRAELSF